MLVIVASYRSATLPTGIYRRSNSRRLRARRYLSLLRQGTNSQRGVDIPECRARNFEQDGW